MNCAPFNQHHIITISRIRGGATSYIRRIVCVFATTYNEWCYLTRGSTPMFEIIAAFIICILWGTALVRTWLGMQLIRSVPEGLPLPSQPPLVSVIIAAKEEQENI